MQSTTITRSLRYVFIGLFLHLAAACAPTVNIAKLDGVKKLAVVGYTATIEPEDNSFDLSVLSSGNQAEENAVTAYNQLTVALSDHLKWEVVPYTEMTGNADYQMLYAKTQEGGLAGLQSALSGLTADFHPAGIIWAYRAEGLSQEQREELFDMLGVDAIATARIFIRPKSSSIMFIKTSTTYSAQVVFRVWARGSEEEIWKDMAATGEESDGTGGFKIAIGGLNIGSQDQKAYLQAVELGYVALLERYDEARKSAEVEQK